MRHMTHLELDLMMPHIRYSDRAVWDVGRILALYVAAPHMKNKVNIQEMFPLPWDSEMPDTTEADIMAHTARMNELAKNL